MPPLLTAARRPSRPSGSKRQVRWTGFTVFANSLADNAEATTSLVDTRTNLELIGSTVVRIRGAFGARLASSGNMANAAEVIGGIMVVTVDAQAIGPTAVPNPFGDADASWLWYSELIMQGDGSNDLAQVNQAMVDVKAMRKLRANEVLVLAFENRSNVIADIMMTGRLLLKLA